MYDLRAEDVAEAWGAGRSLHQLVAAAHARGEVDAVPVRAFGPRSFVDLDTPREAARWGAVRRPASANQPDP